MPTINPLKQMPNSHPKNQHNQMPNNQLPNQLLHQHWCVDDNLIKDLIKEANLSKEDIVLEIGAGKGALTKELAKHCKKIIAVEIDIRLKKSLTVPENVELIFADALKIIDKRNDFNKIVSNLPYQAAEPLLHYLCLTKNVSLSVLTVPKKFAQKAQLNPIFSAFLNIEIVREVSKESFDPRPKIKSALIRITKNEKTCGEADEKKRDDLFIRRKLYLQRDKKLRNGLRETLIDYYRLKNKILTKKQAKEIIGRLEMDEEIGQWSNTLIALIPAKLYSEISRKIIKLAKQ